MSRRTQRAARRARTEREKDELLDAEYEEPGPLLEAPLVIEAQPSSSCFSPLGRGAKKLWRKARSSVDPEYKQRMAAKDRVRRAREAAVRQLALLPVQEQRVEAEAEAARGDLREAVRTIDTMKRSIQKLIETGESASVVKAKGAVAFATIKTQMGRASRARATLDRAERQMIINQKKRVMLDRTIEAQLLSDPSHLEDMQLIADTSREVGVDALDAHFDTLDELISAGVDADKVTNERLGDMVNSINEAAVADDSDGTNFEDEILAEIMAAGASSTSIDMASNEALTIAELEALVAPDSVPGESRSTRTRPTTLASMRPRRGVGAEGTAQT